MATDSRRLRRALGGPLRWLRGFLPGLRQAPVILMYHRIASPPYDPFGLCVPPELFREQLRVLRESRAILPLDELVAGLSAGSLPARATALTFDDGYADNFLVAKPLLEELGVPATFFIATGPVVTGEPFWWDELAQMALASRQAAEFDIPVAGMTLSATWTAQDHLPDDLADWRFAHPTSEPRRLAYQVLWSLLQTMAKEDREAAMAALRERIGAGDVLADDPSARPMTQAMLRATPSQLISLGGHGRTHVPLTALPVAVRQEELAGARAELAALAGCSPPSGLAYPHGSHDRATCELVEFTGYGWAVTTRGARIRRKRFDRFALPRLEVGRWNGREVLPSVDSAGY